MIATAIEIMKARRLKPGDLIGYGCRLVEIVSIRIGRQQGSGRPKVVMITGRQYPAWRGMGWSGPITLDMKAPVIRVTSVYKPKC